ncbi:MAG: DNA gyrase inhibitor YacG [Gammaproteobacteria bacterium]
MAAEASTSPFVVKCPHCGKTVAWTEASLWKPFCSERCRIIDLGDWLTERHAIPGDADLPTHDEGTE